MIRAIGRRWPVGRLEPCGRGSPGLRRLERSDLLRVLFIALRVHRLLVADFLALAQRVEGTSHLRAVKEDLRSIRLSDEPESAIADEPLDRAFCHFLLHRLTARSASASRRLRIRCYWAVRPRPSGDPSAIPRSSPSRRRTPVTSPSLRSPTPTPPRCPHRSRDPFRHTY